MMRPFWLLIGCSVACVAWGQSKLPPGPTTTEFPSVQVSPESIPKPALLGMYRQALGERFNDADGDRLYEAHQLLERYFATPSAGDRKGIVKELQGLNLDASMIGRIVPLRMHWPALEAGVYYVNETIGPHEVHYFLGIPAGYDRAKSYPLVIKLPTAHAFLTDPLPSGEEVAGFYKNWINEELTAHPDALVLMPLLNFGYLYGPSYEGMNSVIQAMLHAFERVHLDPARVYLVGHSLAGHAVWNLGIHYPTYFAAIMPLAGSAKEDWQRVRLVNLCNTLPVVWHDVEDPMLKVDFSRQLVNILRAKKINVEYEETKGLGHGPSADLYAKLYAKMRARTRELYPQRVMVQSSRPDSIFNRADWVQMYQPMNPGKERRVWFNHGAGRMLLNENTFSVDATREGNRIDASIDNVESMRFYFNDQMIDLAKPVIIAINKKVRFEGLLQPNLEEMLKDQIFLGRGWRYYTTLIDVDFGPPPVTRPTTATAPTTTTPVTRRGTIEIIPKEGPSTLYRPKE